MSKAILQWLVPLAYGAATAALAWVQAHLGTGPHVDPLIAGAIVGILGKVINFLAGKLPAPPA